MSAAVRNVIDDAQGIISEVPGAGTQVYADDKMMRDVIRAFNAIFKKYDWDQYIEWRSLILDGSTGKITTDSLSDVIDFEDIRGVYRDGESRPLPLAAKSLNPFSYTAAGGSAKLWRSLPVTDADYVSKKFSVLPVTAEGTINLCVKVYPNPNEGDWTFDSVMYLDRDMLAYMTAFVTLISDGLNPDAAEIAKNMMEMKYKDIIAMLAGRPVALHGHGGIVNDWTQVP